MVFITVFALVIAGAEFFSKVSNCSLCKATSVLEGKVLVSLGCCRRQWLQSPYRATARSIKVYRPAEQGTSTHIPCPTKHPDHMWQKELITKTNCDKSLKVSRISQNK